LAICFISPLFSWLTRANKLTAAKIIFMAGYG
jgi:hypothetical protein